MAEEVGKLADRSIEQAKSIQRIIDDTVRDIEKETHLVSKSSETMKGVEDAVKNSAIAVRSILEHCLEQQSLTSLVKNNMSTIEKGSGEISIATNEQSVTVGQVSAAVNQLNEIMNEVLTVSHRMTGSIDTLKGQIISLSDIISSK